MKKPKKKLKSEIAVDPRMCWYDDKPFSGGSVVKMPSHGGDVYKLCQSTNGEWIQIHETNDGDDEA